MSYLQAIAFRPSLRVLDRHNTHHGSAAQRISPLKISNHHNSLHPTLASSNTKLMIHYMTQRTAASHNQQCTPVCLFGGNVFGGRGGSRKDNEPSPWDSFEKAMSNIKKEQSLEDVLRQQMEKGDYYGGDPPTGGGGGGGGGSGGMEDEGFAGILDDIVQVTCAILALIVVYLYVIGGDRVMPFLTGCFEFLAGKRGPRIRTIMQTFGRFYQKLRAKVRHDPYWVEKAIIATPTNWDSPKKYKNMLKSYKRKSRPARRKTKYAVDSDSDDNDDDNNNTYGEDVDDEL